MWLESVHLSLSHSDLIVLTWWNPTSPFSEPHKSSWDMEIGDRTKWASKFVDFRKEKEQRERERETRAVKVFWHRHHIPLVPITKRAFHTLLTLE